MAGLVLGLVTAGFGLATAAQAYNLNLASTNGDACARDLKKARSQKKGVPGCDAACQKANVELGIACLNANGALIAEDKSQVMLYGVPAAPSFFGCVGFFFVGWSINKKR